jgi:hypothetical protein
VIQATPGATLACRLGCYASVLSELAAALENWGE